MKQFTYLGMLLMTLAVMFSSCEAVGDIFQAGMGIGIFVAVLVVILIIWLVNKARR
jgi:hypothetical protein